MRVLHLLDPAVLRRTEYRSRTVALVDALRGQGVQTVQLAAPAAFGADEDSLELDAALPAWHVYRTPAPAWPRSLPRACPSGLQLAASSAALLLRLCRLAHLTRPDLIHVHAASGSVVALPALATFAAAGLRSLPLVVEADRRTIGVAAAPRRMEHWALGRAAALTASSLEMRAALRAAGVACRRIAVIPAASELAGMPRVERQPAGLEGAPLLAFAGQLDRASGIGLLLDVFATLRKRQPALRLVVAGGGPGVDALAQRIGVPDVRGHVVITGRLSARRAADVLPRADIAVFPGLPGAGEALAPSRHLLNALAQGCAVVASDIACHRELLVHGHSAMLFPAGSRRALVELLADLLRRPERRLALGRAAQQLAAVRLSWSETASCYRTLYQDVLAASQPDRRERKFRHRQ